MRGWMQERVKGKFGDEWGFEAGIGWGCTVRREKGSVYVVCNSGAAPGLKGLMGGLDGILSLLITGALRPCWFEGDEDGYCGSFMGFFQNRLAVWG